MVCVLGLEKNSIYCDNKLNKIMEGYNPQYLKWKNGKKQVMIG